MASGVFVLTIFYLRQMRFSAPAKLICTGGVLATNACLSLSALCLTFQW